MEVKEVMTFAEASQLWGLGNSTLRVAVRDGRLHNGHDCWKSAGTWLVTKGAMERLYGVLPNGKEIR